MRITRRTPRTLVRRFLQVMLAAQLSIVATLMATTKVRTMLRGQRSAGLAPDPAEHVPLDHSGTAEVFTYGADLFDRMIADVDAATDRILLETYIWKNDATGQRFKDALVRAARRGVDVYVVYDRFANLVVSPRFLRMPRPIHVLAFPLVPKGLQFFNPRRLGRDHRKILVVDGAVGYVGGYNIGALYATEWRDTHLRLEGPTVWDLDNAFVDFWNQHRPRRSDEGPILKERGAPSWDPRLRAHRNTPSHLMYPIRGMYLEAIDRATERICITAAYFIPDRDIHQALLTAARRGVQVDILLPEVSNHVLADWLSRGFYGSLLAAGVNIHQYRDAMVHAKTATIDGRWSTIGTANIDRLSLTGNYEINVEIIDDAVAATMGHIFDRDLERSVPLTREAWERRNVVKRLCELVLSPLRPLL